MGGITGLISGERHFDWPQLEERVLRAAGGFERSGIEPGQSVALLLRNDIAFVEASLAIQRLGAYAVPINWHFTKPEVRYILEDSAARLLVVHADLWRALALEVPADFPVMIVATPPELRKAYALSEADARMPPGALDWEEWLASQAPSQTPPRPTRSSMIYTSGTTGKPKGVRRGAPTLAQMPAIEAMVAQVYGVVPGMRSIVAGPLYHSAPNAVGLRAARMRGCVVLMPRFDPQKFLALVERHRLDHAFMVPTMFSRLLKLPEAARRRHDISSLAFVVHAAAPCPPDVKARMIEWWGPVLVEFYGGTETGAVTFCDSAEWLARPGTVGRVIGNAVLKVLDEEGRELPPGKPGELFMRVDCYPDFTYQNQPDERRRIDRQGLVTIGDIGYFDDEGYLYLCDRKRDMIISGGVNIYPAEIEAVLHMMPGLHDCAVFGIPHAEYGEEVMAVVQPQDGHALAPEAVIEFLGKSLAGYKLPRRIEIRADLPREDSGKILKRALREPYWRAAGRRI